MGHEKTDLRASPLSDAERQALEVGLPSMHAWSADGEPSRLVQRSIAKDDPDPKAISSCYDGLHLPELKET